MIPWLGRGLLIAAVAATFANAVGNGFVYDDQLLIVDDPAVRMPLSSGFAGLHYRPLRTLSYRLDHAVAGMDPRAFHLSNILYHGATTLLVHAALGATIELRLRSNPNFHLADDARPLILIGNGSGMAGLRSLLKQRIARGQRRNWLLFGERNASCDFHYGEDILRWQGEGFLDRLDLAFSRDQAERVHVQDRLRAVAPLLRAWIDAGAAIHVCGSREGMAPGVEAVLVESIGRAGVDHLMATGRYRRDVY